MKKTRRRSAGRLKRNKSSRSMAGQYSPKANTGHPQRNTVLSPSTQLIPVSLVFHGPELLVETFLLNLRDRSSQVKQTPHFLNPTLVKGCEQRFAIEDSGAIRLCTPSYYREDRPSLIWDEQEGSLAKPPLLEERLDDPADLAQELQSRTDSALIGPLNRSIKKVSTTSLKVTERESSHVTYGDNCLMWCSSVRPRTRSEWKLWNDSLDDSYDHVTVIRDPHLFASALGTMGLQQKGLRGSGTSFYDPVSGEVTQCASLPLVYGPVIYTERRREYIEESSSELELILRGLFTKTSEHRNQREYRFALFSNSTLEEDTLELNMSADMFAALRQKGRPRNTAQEGASVAFNTCLPSPRILRCLSAATASQHGGIGIATALNGRVQSHFHLAGVEHKQTTKIERAVQELEEVDDEILEQAVAEEQGLPNDSRIIKLTLDGGPDSTITLYDFGGLAGLMQIRYRSGEAIVSVNFSDPESKFRAVVVDNSNFDGSSIVYSSSRRLKLLYRAANPLTRVEWKLCDADLTRGTVTAVSEDGTATSTFEIALDAGLGINAQQIELVSANEAGWLPHNRERMT